MATVTETVEVKQFTEAALNAEIGRRKNNKGREKTARTASWALGKLTKPQFVEVKAGGTVRVVANSGRKADVSLKAS